MSIYKSAAGKKKIISLYNAQLKRLEFPYNDIGINTSFGKTHLIKTENPSGIPLWYFMEEMQQLLTHFFRVIFLYLIKEYQLPVCHFLSTDKKHKTA